MINGARARLLAHYLPQFHPIPENDRFWEPGFTEWTNVRRTQPLFEGHQQPRRPGELGYYDLRAPQIRQAQANLAEAHGIEAFCYWHYWFAGRHLLEQPMEAVLRSGEPDFPFCIGWANESWTDVWRGNPDRIFVEQTYPGPDDDDAHFAYLLPFLRDPRYLRVRGRPLLLVYRPDSLPDPNATFDRWRQRALEAGLEGLFLVGYKPRHRRARFYDLDAAAWSNPHVVVGEARDTGPEGPKRVFDFAKVSKELPGPAELDPEDIPSIVTGWDNSPRWGKRATILTGCTPEAFAQHVKDVLHRVEDRPPEDRLVFVKSWNEWAEGNYLEPDGTHGRGLLEALRREVLP